MPRNRNSRKNSDREPRPHSENTQAKLPAPLPQSAQDGNDPTIYTPPGAGMVEVRERMPTHVVGGGDSGRDGNNAPAAQPYPRKRRPPLFKRVLNGPLAFFKIVKFELLIGLLGLMLALG